MNLRDFVAAEEARRERTTAAAAAAARARAAARVTTRARAAADAGRRPSRGALVRDWWIDRLRGAAVVALVLASVVAGFIGFLALTLVLTVPLMVAIAPFVGAWHFAALGCVAFTFGAAWWWADATYRLRNGALVIVTGLVLLVGVIAVPAGRDAMRAALSEAPSTLPFLPEWCPPYAGGCSPE